MTTLRVRRRSPVVEAVQWHKPWDYPGVYKHFWPGPVEFRVGEEWRPLREGDWLLTAEDGSVRVLTPEQFEAEYEPVDAPLHPTDGRE